MAWDSSRKDPAGDLRRELQVTQKALKKAEENAAQARWAPGRGGAGGGGSGGDRDWGAVDEVVGRYATAAVGAVVGFGALLLGAGHLAAGVTGAGWPAYELRDAPGIVGRFITNPLDPAAAWEPVNTGGELPGAGVWWVILLVLVLLVTILIQLFRRALRREEAGRAAPDTWDDPDVPEDLDPWDGQPRGGDLDGGAGRQPGNWWWWAGGRSGADRRPDMPGIVVGTDRRRPVTLDPLHSLLVVGPAHSGKTSGVAIPALLEWEGPAVVASTKGHLMDETIGWRKRQGEAHVYDPAGITGHPSAGWSPLADCGTWQGAIRTAQQLTAAAKAAVGGRLDGGDPGRLDEGTLWGSAMSMSLAPFLYAAAADGRSIVETAEWIEREERDEVVNILRPMDTHAAHVHETTFFRGDQARSAYFHTMFQVLSVYSDPTVAATADRHDIVARDLITGRPLGEEFDRLRVGRRTNTTVYLTAPEHDQLRFQPLFATIVRQIVTAVNERFAASAGQMLDPPLLVLLDEAIGVAALEALAELASAGSSKGVQVVSTFESLDRLADLPGDVPALLARNHRAKLLLPGTTGLAARLAPPATLDKLGEGEGALVYDGEEPRRIQLRRWYRDDELHRRGTYGTPVGEGRNAVVSGPVAAVDDPGYELVEEAGMFGRRRRPAPEPLPDPVSANDAVQPGVEVAGRSVPSVDDILGR